MRSTDHPPAAPPPPSRRGPLIALLLTGLLLLGGLFLMHVLHRSAQLQDCVLAGRANC